VIAKLAEAFRSDGQTGGAARGGWLAEGDGRQSVFADDLPAWEEEFGLRAIGVAARVEGERRDDAWARADAGQAGIQSA
jgi:hypothetical protein